MRLSGALLLAALLCSAAKGESLTVCDLLRDLKSFNGRTVQVQAELFLDKDRTLAEAICTHESLAAPSVLSLDPATGLPSSEKLALDRARRESMETRRLNIRQRVTAILEGTVQMKSDSDAGIALTRISDIQTEVLPDAADVPVIDACDLIVNLTAYNGKRVAIRGETQGTSGDSIYGIGCKKRFEIDGSVWPPILYTRDAGFTHSIEQDRSRAAKATSDAEELIHGRRNVRATITAVGIVHTRARYETNCDEGRLLSNGFGALRAAPAEVLVEAKLDPVVETIVPSDEDRWLPQCAPPKRVQQSDCSRFNVRDAADNGCLERVRELVAPKPVDQATSALVRAATQGFADVVRMLLKSGVPPNVPDGDILPLCEAIVNGRTDAVEVLLAFGALPDNSSNSECGMLGAAVHGDPKMIHSLAVNGATLEVPDYQGRTPLMVAAVSARANVHALLKAGANVNARDNNGDTALSLSSSVQRETTVELLNARADPNTPGKGGVTPLMHAALASRDDIVRLLLDAGATVDLRDAIGETALHKAIRSGYTDAIAVLLEAGADPRIRNADGKTPADLANKYQLEALQHKP